MDTIKKEECKENDSFFFFSSLFSYSTDGANQYVSFISLFFSLADSEEEKKRKRKRPKNRHNIIERNEKNHFICDRNTRNSIFLSSFFLCKSKRRNEFERTNERTIINLVVRDMHRLSVDFFERTRQLRSIYLFFIEKKRKNNTTIKMIRHVQ